MHAQERLTAAAACARRQAMGGRRLRLENDELLGVRHPVEIVRVVVPARNRPRPPTRPITSAGTAAAAAAAAEAFTTEMRLCTLHTSYMMP
jgi:hypothetical protein